VGVATGVVAVGVAFGVVGAVAVGVVVPVTAVFAGEMPNALARVLASLPIAPIGEAEMPLNEVLAFATELESAAPTLFAKPWNEANAFAVAADAGTDCEAAMPFCSFEDIDTALTRPEIALPIGVFATEPSAAETVAFALLYALLSEAVRDVFERPREAFSDFAIEGAFFAAATADETALRARDTAPFTEEEIDRPMAVLPREAVAEETARPMELRPRAPTAEPNAPRAADKPPLTARPTAAPNPRAAEAAALPTPRPAEEAAEPLPEAPPLPPPPLPAPRDISESWM